MAPRFSGLQAVLFDLDGTLIDSAPDLGGAAESLRRARGLPPLPLEDYRAHAGSGARGMLRVAFGITPDHHEFAELRSAFLDAYEVRMLELTRPFEGVSALLDTLNRAGMPWGVVTNKMERLTHPIVQALRLFDSAGALVCGDTTPHPKPHPAPLLEAAQRLGVEPAHCLYVGDDLRDIVAGRAAGMSTVAACYGYLGADADLTSWGANAHIEQPLDLLKLIHLP
ncbi:MAG: HAD-IA family hydrolase [Hydrogenophaga sp.]|uniref:HAD family hydrolase n=1 Tax=Hydrogenophaga sp. TaxID=1904254 RepID=UPI00169503B7|nr:HAD-IA family hydrolase [Hydrogenophaga sp.]NIM40629.1 HAD-IA family hydrolase [Hydrogenophaga sp.]NIN26104.1 HAD-IA family hydrolase [Hydrogenophaga sp.]NIN30969.1 HAD-IA family hydrolase [Hydrogenophaga sp.]NIN55012.1 HAD-IA family hydrolase [Hydrogenophaga sp.]NIO51055.1 HAD-IA family hydrolase [Hydrogenophaga sp.]